MTDPLAEPPPAGAAILGRVERGVGAQQTALEVVVNPQFGDPVAPRRSASRSEGS